MPHDSSAFLDGAVSWLFGEIPAQCARCGYDWTTDHVAALEVIAGAPARYTRLLSDRDGSVPGPDGGWNATAYLWHLSDLARSWSERWVQLASTPGALLVGWDPDALAAARNYVQLPAVSAVWALMTATETFVALSRALDPSTEFLHGEWGQGTVGDATRWLAHEYTHHELDVGERVVPPFTAN